MENQTMTLAEKALLMHEKWNGKLETIAKSKVNSARISPSITHLALRSHVR